MKKQFFFELMCLISIINSLHGSMLSDCASTIGNIECTVGQFSVVLFLLEKNVLHIERYSLDELAQDINRFSSKDCNDHCLYTLHLGEKGQKVACIDWCAVDMKKLDISTYRGKTNINYLLDWAGLVIKEDEQLQEYMKAPVTIKEIFNMDLSPEKNERKLRWFTALAIQWGVEGHSLDINLIVERNIRSVSCAIIPTCLIDDIGDSCIDMKKIELLNAGLLVLAPNNKGEAKTIGNFSGHTLETQN